MAEFDSDAQQEEEGGIDLTPMLDVVFIMLIFFIVTASFIKEAGAEIIRPEADTAFKQDAASIFIAITPEGEIWIDRERVAPSEVKATIEKLKAETPQGEVMIQADTESKADLLMKVMDAAREAGIKEVAVATRDD